MGFVHVKYSHMGLVQVIKLQVSGMTCSACSGAVEKSLAALDGVESASVSLSLQQAEVHVSSKAVAEVRTLCLCFVMQHEHQPLVCATSAHILRLLLWRSDDCLSYS